MRFTITGRNIEVTPGLTAAVEDKLGKLERLLHPGHRSDRYTQRTERTSENRSNHSRERTYNPRGRIKQ